jgi:DHA1 family tetracycline resistance protein-like MFS transporter
MFAIMPLFAVGGVGMPALQSLANPQVDADNQGRLQGVLASIVSLASVFGPLFFSTIYFGVSPTWPGAIWLVGCAVYALALPLMFGLRSRAPAAILPEARQS